MSPRPHDVSERGLHDWSLTSVESWGESGHGSWRLYIVSRAGSPVSWSVGECHLHLHGVKQTR